MPSLPEKRYLRRGEIIAYLGIDRRDFAKLVGSILTPLYFRGRGRAFFLREQVLQAERDGRIFKPEQAR